LDLAIKRHNAVLIKRIFILIVVLVVTLRIIIVCGLLLSVLRDRWSASHWADRPRAPGHELVDDGPSRKLEILQPDIHVRFLPLELVALRAHRVHRLCVHAFSSAILSGHSVPANINGWAFGFAAGKPERFRV
jgi:hypothetical protein